MNEQAGSIQAAVRALESKQALINQLMGDLAQLRKENARLKITIQDLKAHIARKASSHG